MLLHFVTCMPPVACWLSSAPSRCAPIPPAPQTPHSLVLFVRVRERMPVYVPIADIPYIPYITDFKFAVKPILPWEYSVYSVYFVYSLYCLYSLYFLYYLRFDGLGTQVHRRPRGLRRRAGAPTQRSLRVLGFVQSWRGDGPRQALGPCAALGAEPRPFGRHAARHQDSMGIDGR